MYQTYHYVPRQGNTSAVLTNKTACQIEIQGLTTRVDIQTTLQASEVDHDQEAAEYIAKVGRVVSTLSEGILQTYEQVSLNLSIVSGLPVKYVIFCCQKIKLS